MNRAGYLLFLLTCFLTEARAQHFYQQKYTVNDGLPDSYILHLYQDRQGFLWVGTAGGLSRFDGHEFLNYGYKEGLPDLRIDAICEDHEGRIWVGTRRGIVTLQGRGCVSYPFDDGAVPDFVFRIREDAAHDLWAYTSKGAYRWAGRQWLRQKLVAGWEGHACRDVLETPQGKYINYGEELVHRKPDGTDALLAGKPGMSTYFNVVKPVGSRLFVSLPHSLECLGGKAIFADALHDKHVGAFFCDSRRRFWIATQEAGVLVSAEGSETRITDTFKVQYNLISDIIEDRQGNIWIAGFDGLLKVKEVHYTLFDCQENTNLIQTSTNGLLAATAHGVKQYGNGAWQPFAAGNGLPGPLDDWCMDGYNRSWLMTRERGLYLFYQNRYRRIFTPVTDATGNNRGIAFNRNDGKIYLCADTLLLYGDEKGFSIWRDASSGKAIANARSIVALDNGSLLVWTADNAFWLLDAEHRARKITEAFDIPRTNQHVRFYVPSPGRIWLLYNGGMSLYRWDQQQRPIRELELTARDGLPGDAVNAMTQDRNGRLWVATSAGIVVVDTAGTREGRQAISPLSREEGLFEDQWSNIGLLLDSAGMVWVRLPDRLVRLDPEHIRLDHRAPPAAIESIVSNRQPDAWRSCTDSLYGYRQLPRQLRLPYYLNGLTISYRSPSFSAPAGVEYSYALEGADGRWSLPSHNNSVTFDELPPGDYRFRVRARLSSTPWGEPAELAFVIGRPYWDSYPFRCAAGLLTLALVVGLFRWRMRQYQRKARLREQLRELELTALRAQMNPHFIYNALNSIQALVLDDKPEKASQYISKFGRLLRQVLHHSDRPVISLAEELEALDGYLQLEQLRLHIDLHYQIQPDDAINPEAERVPPLILQPFAENALWHGLSRKPGEKRLEILLHLEGPWLVVEIADNGIGRAAAAARRRQDNTPKGMEITGRRIRQFNGGPDIGMVETIDLYDAGGQAAGTKVILRMRRRKE